MEKLFSLTRALVARKRKIFALFFALAASVGLSWAGVAVDGRLPGEFSIAKNKKVYFSQGNLQYNKSTKKWSFMTNQYDRVETDKQEVGTNYANQNIVSFFCWGNGNNPTGTSEGNKQKFTDYGVNPISNGGNAANIWRTLSELEWVYMLNQYNNPNYRQGNRFAKAKLFGTTYGLIVFPDGYTHPSGVAAVSGMNKTDGTSWNANQYSAADWAKMEAAGCVFLPAAGIRWGTMIRYVGTEANYWTSTPVDNTLSKYEVFTQNNFASVSKEDRNGYGMSVRLVLDKAYYKVTYKCTDKTSGTVPSDVTSYLKGSLVTVKGAGDLAKTGYIFAGWVTGTTTYTGGQTFNITANLTLTAQWTLDMAPVNNVIALINAIGTVTYPGSGDKITAAREAYDALAVQAQKDAVTNYTTLTDAEAAYLALQPDVVAGKIDAIGEVTYTAECKAKIDEARAAYDALPPATQAQVGNYAKLQAAEATYAELLAQAVKAVKDQIDALPATPLTDATKKLSEYNKVKAARAAYDALSDEEKAAVDNYDKLTAAEAAFAAIPSVGSETVITWDKNTGIEKISGTTTSPAYEGITISIKGGGFSPEGEMLRFNIAGLGLSFEFANTLGENFQKIVISSTNAMPSTPLAGMGEGWAASNENKTATWTGDAATVKIWDGLTATSYWDVNTIQFTFGATVSATEAAQAALDKINAIPSPVAYDEASRNAIKAAREAVDALGANASLIDDADLQKLTDAEAAYATAKTEAVNAVKTAINALPATPLTDATKKLSEYNKVTDARALYDALLNADDKDMVTNLAKLEAAEAAFAAISGGGNAPAGALSGAFTINADGDQILFSKGNLQYQASTTTLRFATNQYDMIGADNANISDTYTGWIDLFGWGTGNNPAKASTVDGDYSTFTDWGTNAISNGGNEANLWRTMTVQGWNYLIRNRTNAANLKGQATVADVHGYVLLPDSWTLPAGLSFTASPNNWTTNVYTAEQWAQMEAAGAVFLPATGHRDPEIKGVGEKGWYWSSTPLSDIISYDFEFNDTISRVFGSRIYFGQPVRLVAAAAPSPLNEAQAALDKINAIPQPVVYTPECKEAIKAAREALDALSDEAKALFNEADTAALPAAETTYADLLAEKVAPVIAAIDAVPATPLTDATKKLSEYNKVTDARALYDALATDEEKAAVTNYDKLTAAEAAFAAVGGGGGSAPAGALNGKFTIDESSVVYFSKGNLQATTTDLGANWTWGFAANQYDVIGNAAANNAVSGNGTVSANGTVDLFGWSTATTKYGIHNGTSGNISDYAGDFKDWGATMGDGWFTLSKEQWTYLLDTRTGDKAATVNSVADCRYTKATINTDGTAVIGIILFPDGGTFAESEFTEVGSPNTANVDFTTTCTTAQWNALQTKGCVFLPAAGDRYGASVSSVGSKGYYWSSSPRPSTDDAYYVYIYSNGVSPVFNDFRCIGQSVRLVAVAAPSPLADAQAAKDLIDAIPQPVVYTPECKEAIKAARETLDALGDEAKALFNEADTAALPAAEATYAGLLAEKVAPVIAAIDAVPATPLTDATAKLSEYNKVTDARALYDALATNEEKAAVDNYDKLTAAEAAFAAIGGGGGSAPAGALSGKFTINADGDQISFAKGNLQATTTDLGDHWTWSFAANQWDYLGIAVANSKINGNGTVSENGTVDLFGWSTAATYYGINNSYKAVDYIGDFVDWGPNMGAGWRTLTKDEWNYLIENNTKGRATVNDKNGYIFLPNDWSGPAFTANPDNFTTNVYSGDDWTAMENAGAVFLPSGPARNGTYALIANDAKYCSSTSLNNDTSYVFTIYYNQSQSACTGTNRAYGCMVRLVTVGAPSPLADAQAAKDLIDAIPQPVVYTPECKEAIKEAREALDALSDEAKALFNEADTAALPAAETAYAGLLAEKVAPVIAAIDAVPATPLTDATKKLSEYNKVTDARALYDALATDEEKDAVTNYDKLTAAEAAFAAISGGSTPVDIVWNGNTGIANVSPTTTSPAYEGMTVTVGQGSSFSTYQSRLYFTFNSQPNGGFIFANENGTNITKVVIESTTALTSTMKEVDRMGSGWVISNENKTATWTGNADSVKIWEGQHFANYWVVDSIVFTVNGASSPLADAQAALDKINAIPDPVVVSDECNAAIKAAREAVTALGENASLLDEADITKLAKAEADFALLIKDATTVVAKIGDIGEVIFSPECKAKIVDAREAYDALSDELKPYVSNLATLTAAEAAYETARPFAPVTTVPAAVEALQYTGAAQALITAGVAEHGTILYSLDGENYSTELPTALLAGAYTVYYKVQATDDYKDVAPATFTATIAYNYPDTYSLFGIPEGWSVKVNDEEVAVVNGAVKNIAANDRFEIMPVQPEIVKRVEVVPYLLDLATVTDSVIYILDGDSITGTANGNISIVIVPDAKVYFKDVNLTNTGSHPAVLCGGNAEMVVVGENMITCTTEGEYGIRTAGAGTTLTISGDKTLLNATIDPNGGTVNQ